MWRPVARILFRVDDSCTVCGVGLDRGCYALQRQIELPVLRDSLSRLLLDRTFVRTREIGRASNRAGVDGTSS